jgi:SNF2 family DNA or RNA helicase
MIQNKKRLSKLLPKERRILQYLSIFWEQISPYEFKKLIESMGIKSHTGQNLSPQYISLLENSFVKKRLIRSTNCYWGTGFQIFDTELKEELIREASMELWFSQACREIQKTFPISDLTLYQYEGKKYASRLLRDFRISIYRRQPKLIAHTRKELCDLNLEDSASELLNDIFSNPFQEKLLRQLDTEIQISVLVKLLKDKLEKVESTDKIWGFIDEYGLADDSFNQFRADSLLLQGDFSKAEALMGNIQTVEFGLIRATIHLLKDNYKKSIDQFLLAIELWRNSNNKKEGYPDDWKLFLYSLLLLRQGNKYFNHFLEEIRRHFKNHPSSSLIRAVNTLSNYLQNKDSESNEEIDQINSSTLSGKLLITLVSAIVPSLRLPLFTNEFTETAKDLGYRWVELELLTLLKKKQSLKKPETLTVLEKVLGIRSVSALVPELEDWQKVLNAIRSISNNTSAVQGEKRICWRLDFLRKEIQPIEQKRTKQGWSKGRKIPLKTLRTGKLELTEQDNVVVRTAMESSISNRHYSPSYYTFNWEKALLSLVGHPHIYLTERPRQNIQLVRRLPQLSITENEDIIELSFDVPIKKQGLIIEKETESRYLVIEASEYHVAISDSFPAGKVEIPRTARADLIEVLKPLSSTITIQSDLEEHRSNYPTVEADNRIYVLLTEIKNGFHLEFFVKPFGKYPPYFKPGIGPRYVVSEINGIKTQTLRDLEKERRLLNRTEGNCPILAESEALNYEWNLNDTETCLEALTQLESPRKRGDIVIEWAKGQKLKLLGRLGSKDVSLKVAGSEDWFKVSGKIQVNDHLVLSMKELIGSLDENSNRFIELTDGNFIAITEKLRKHLNSIKAITDANQKLHKLRSGVLEDFLEELDDYETDQAWEENLARLEAGKNFKPKLSKSFKNVLRPYQVEGYFWLSRLANLGVGACLADDMGLGKTLQALALMEERGKLGPTLVVAPVSVCRNWINEGGRFTPNLNFYYFGETDRIQLINGLRENDVVVTSYNLLQLEERLFTKKRFATIVLDEAQAVKNRATKRSKTVMNLKGDFRLVTTGTPIENHLLELSNIFNFINPGLLGSYNFFRKKFAVPIQKSDDEDARRTLKTLIKPYVLRRLKGEVLDDLPEKTEITLSIQLSEKERALYESIRQQALEKIEDNENGDSDKRFRIFAELTKLRQASCHPKLVDKRVSIESSKLKQFEMVVDDLIENNHKALVFSQFVKHLKIVADFLSKKGIEYHYLDGQTRPQNRQKEIDEFQNDGKPLFLISLKAGGTGLNLTQADYVIHLDPWWNPAVEDQATDRAHRIGQTRPVTVYRLVAEDTVEEKIVKLHNKKRELADSLLMGAGSSSKLNSADLLALIKESN